MKRDKLIAMVLFLLPISFGLSTTTIAAGDAHQEALLKLQTKADTCRKAGHKRCLFMCNRAMQEGKRNHSSEKFKTLSNACLSSPIEPEITEHHNTRGQ